MRSSPLKAWDSGLAAVLSSVVLLMASGAAAGEYQPGDVIVKYKDQAVRTRTVMDQLYDAAGIRAVRRYSPVMKGMEQLILNDNVKVPDAVAALKRSGIVEYAQPDYILHAYPLIPATDAAALKPAVLTDPCVFPGIPYPPGCTDNNGGTDSRPALQPAPPEVIPPVADPDLGKAYGIAKIGATKAWSINKGSKSFIVGVIDTGIDYNHEDLSFNMWRNPNPSDKQDVVGYDFIHDDGLPYDDNEHGTHTSGTIGAVGGNGIGISGVDQRVSIMALKFLDADGSGTTADAIRAIDYAINHGARVLSNSWGGKGDDDNQALLDAINQAKAKDVLFVAAAGNDGTDNDAGDPDYPAGFNTDNMIAVAATDSDDSLASFSNYGAKSVEVGAPGGNIYSTVPGNQYATFSGTSMACPHVAGAAALIWSKDPSLHYDQVKKILMQTVDVVPDLQGKTVTGGRINVYRALTRVR